MKQSAELITRIVLVEDHSIVREGVRALLELENDLEVIGDFACVDSSLGVIREAQPDLVITDLGLPRRSGIELLDEVRVLSPNTRTLVLTAHGDEDHVRAAFKAGAHGYILKDAKHGELLRGIRSIADREHFLCEATAGKMLAGFLGHREPPPEAPRTERTLTQRERQVLSGIAAGQSNKSIARELDISPKTVEKHRTNLMRKLQLHNAAAITMFAIRHGMADGEPLTKSPGEKPAGRSKVRGGRLNRL